MKDNILQIFKLAFVIWLAFLAGWFLRPMPTPLPCLSQPDPITVTDTVYLPPDTIETQRTIYRTTDAALFAGIPLTCQYTP